MKYENPTPELIYSKFVDFKTKTRIILKNQKEYIGIIQSFSPGTGHIGDIKRWHFLESKNYNEFEINKSNKLLINIDHSSVKSIESLTPNTT